MAFQGNLHLLPRNDLALIEEEMRKLKYGRNAPARPQSPPRGRGPQRRRQHPARVPTKTPEAHATT